MRTRLDQICLVLANVFLVAALLSFAKGFFPHKAFLPGLASWSPDADDAGRPAPPFDKVIFMVVDALRSDFVYSNASSFAFVQSLIQTGAAIPFTGHASPPTITMPRVKAITTGSVPSFVDLILNFAESDTSSTLRDQDSWLAQLKARGDNLTMYGDDTWLRLFPDFFRRADGTTSFFVSDFTEVDNNVTRHIPGELKRNDWSAMTLHFLGLDHIGHKTGPKGPNMPGKQAEMDGIVKSIFTAMEEEDHLKSCLLVLLGDHGMNEGGNHGASSAGEVSTALTFMSPKLAALSPGLASPIHDSVDYKYYDVVSQSDIVPTLAALLDFPIPRNNLGVIIPQMLNLWPNTADRERLLYKNAEQIAGIAAATFSSFVPQDVPQDCSTTDGDDTSLLACRFRRIWTDRQGGERSPNFQHDALSFLSLAQSVLSGTATAYDLQAMVIGTVLALISLLLLVPQFASVLLSSGTTALLTLFVIVVYVITMFASSYVEEEQQFWYWILAGYLLILSLKSGRFTSNQRLTPQLARFLAFVLFLITRRWRQTGQKYAGDPDLLTDLIIPNPYLLWISVTTTYAYLSRRLSRNAATSMGSKQMGLLPVLVCISAFLFKLNFTQSDAPELIASFPILNPLITFISRYPLTPLARVVFLGLVHLFGCAIYYHAPWTSTDALFSFLSSGHDILSVFLITQTRTVYVPLFLLWHVQLSLLKRARCGALEASLLGLLNTYASFFMVGGTNSIATIDLSNAYNGVSGYMISLVGILTFASNWAGPIWWAFGTLQLFGARDMENGAAGTWLTTSSMFASVHTLAVMVACTVLREHLFIWTVFSPKYLYTAAWAVGLHGVVIGGFTGSVMLMAQRGRS